MTDDQNLQVYMSMLGEQRVWADGCSILTCGATTGHSVRPLAFCDTPETAQALAQAFMASIPLTTLEELNKAHGEKT